MKRPIVVFLSVALLFFSVPAMCNPPAVAELLGALSELVRIAEKPELRASRFSSVEDRLSRLAKNPQMLEQAMIHLSGPDFRNSGNLIRSLHKISEVATRDGSFSDLLQASSYNGVLEGFGLVEGSPIRTIFEHRFGDQRNRFQRLSGSVPITTDAMQSIETWDSRIANIAFGLQTVAVAGMMGAALYAFQDRIPWGLIDGNYWKAIVIGTVGIPLQNWGVFKLWWPVVQPTANRALLTQSYGKLVDELTSLANSDPDRTLPFLSLLAVPVGDRATLFETASLEVLTKNVSRQQYRAALVDVVLSCFKTGQMARGLAALKPVLDIEGSDELKDIAIETERVVEANADFNSALGQSERRHLRTRLFQVALGLGLVTAGAQYIHPEAFSAFWAVVGNIASLVGSRTLLKWVLFKRPPESVRKDVRQELSTVEGALLHLMQTNPARTVPFIQELAIPDPTTHPLIIEAAENALARLDDPLVGEANLRIAQAKVAARQSVRTIRPYLLRAAQGGQVCAQDLLDFRP